MGVGVPAAPPRRRHAPRIGHRVAAPPARSQPRHSARRGRQRGRECERKMRKGLDKDLLTRNKLILSSRERNM
ncbi:hypothetical protein E2C01_056923 [Portunus trituberculatus]|uniref:Uncharacterized protein n=1 Tax=Portunus trituberculatus TaxID=210409 RepID=A0A5B7H1Y1_PORTR|nr:hypothetical protein [Portunus trituberculatus]